MVQPPSHPLQVVAGGMIPTIMVSSPAAETTLSASPRSTPRVSTSSANVAGGDVCKVIQQCPLSSPNTALIGADSSWALRCAKIPDYGVQEHIAFACAPFFEGIESWSQYKKRRHTWEEH